MSRLAVWRNCETMLCAMGRISSGSESGTARTHGMSSSRVMADTSPRSMPQSSELRAFSLSRVPPQSGQTSCLRNFSTRFMPLSSFTFESAFSTV